MRGPAPSALTPSASPEFAAWVPTITGHLSFSFIGHGVTDCLAANSETATGSSGPIRRVMVLQRRTTRDLPYTRWPMALLRPWIRANYLLIGQTAPAQRPMLGPRGGVNQTLDDMGVLEGEILVIPHHDKKAQREAAKILVRKLQGALAGFSDAAPRGVAVDIDRLDQEARTWLANAEAAGTRLIKAEFRLYRTGEFRLRMIQSPPLVGAPAGSPAALRFEEILARQIYYFAKDIAHRHYHHEETADNLLPLVAAPAGDDETWRRETLWSLARAVLEVRRRDQLSDYKGALGLLAYAAAFQSAMARVVRDASGRFVAATRIAPYDFEHTRASLEAKIEEKSWITSGWSQFWTVMITTLIAAAALWIAGVQIRDAACGSLAPPAASSSAPASGFDVTAHLAQSQKDGRPAASLDLKVAQPQSRPSPTCPVPNAPPGWAARLLLHAVADPGGLIGLLSLAGFLYFEFARRSLRSVRASRFLVSSPWEWLSALGGTVSRRVRHLSPLWGDRIGAGVALLGALGFLGFLIWAFVALL